MVTESRQALNSRAMTCISILVFSLTPKPVRQVEAGISFNL
ncbi:hypothetical protein BVRB_8g187950 isoform B [Beta vulgaris subsp. vulgaris]|nr:hypothetical protein BVRB_8g187950 isoform B [Beta vulgaris subsp. vulgaris]